MPRRATTPSTCQRFCGRAIHFCAWVCTWAIVLCVYPIVLCVFCARTIVSYARKWHLAAAAAALIVAVGIAIITSRQSHSLGEYGATSTERQVVCNAHGRLEMLARYPGDPINAFEILKLNPHEAPFYPSERSYRRNDDWYEKVHDAVLQRHTEMMVGAKAGLKPLSDREILYVNALTMCSSILEKDEPRRFYLEVFLPKLEKEIEGKPRECVWPLVHEFNRRECRATWPTLGMAADMKKCKPIANPACD